MTTLVTSRPVRRRVAEVLRVRGRQVRRHDPDVGVGDLAVRDQLLHRAARGVDRHREADPLGRAGVAADLRVDPDHAAARVEQRAARVAVVDRRIGLDRVDERVAGGQRVDRAARCRDDADAERVRVAEGAADRGDGRADGDGRGVAERNRCERVVARVDLQQSHVVEDVPADDPRRRRGRVLELDVDPVGAVNRAALRPAVVITCEFVRM